ncbi:uncharacterized protein LOC129951005 [Eupeodes corollae]|uniref:uncharacterized protein LOC129951005 n=1 Tax=Eupeodes corollae TaxID=290404 RepID=UPI00248F4CFD|nr:uncharacterized protein LOC129951005 [Eupeodes corollae]
MFKKNKNTIQPPTSPSVNELLEDIGTFHVERPVTSKTRSLETGHNLSEWWKSFETFVEDIEDLTSIHTEINGYKLKLESAKLDVETKSKVIKNDVGDNLKAADIS